MVIVMVMVLVLVMVMVMVMVLVMRVHLAAAGIDDGGKEGRVCAELDAERVRLTAHSGRAGGDTRCQLSNSS